MDDHSLLLNAVTYLAAAVIAVPVSKRLGLGSVLGYLIAGVAIGPWVLKLITNVEDILHLSEFGVVLLLFLIGLELNPKRLWQMRRPIVGLGGAQVIITMLAILAIGTAMGFTWQVALIIGMALALSSTAISIQLLKDRNLLRTHAGNSAFSVLLFQDIAVIPMLIVIPILSANGSASADNGALLVAKGTAAIVGVVLLGRYIFRPVFRYIAASNMREIFTAFSLLLVIGISLLMQSVGLSMGLGAFLAGVLLAESEYRHELEINLEPFKGLLMGLFFTAVGMSINFAVLIEQPLLIAVGVLGLLTLKMLILGVLGRIFGINLAENRLFTIVLSQGGEFAFVIFAAAATVNAIPQSLQELLTLVVTISMITSPLLLNLNDRLSKLQPSTAESPLESDLPDEHNEVIIAGFGRFGQVVGRMLMAQGFGITVIEHDPNQIELVRRWGYKVFYGDSTRIEILEAAGADHAKVLVVALDSVEMITETVAQAKARFPKLTIMARSRNRPHTFELMSLGTHVVGRETFGTALEVGSEALRALGYPAYEARRAMLHFRDHDEAALLAQFPHHKDEVALITMAKAARQELEDQFKRDKAAMDKIKEESDW